MIMSDKTPMEETTFYFTVGELIEALKAFPRDLPVVISGYESGFENFFLPVAMKLQHLPDNPYWDGEFQFAGKEDKNSFEGVVLQRVCRDD